MKANSNIPPIDKLWEVFRLLQNQTDEFFEYVNDDVDWTVEGHHPMAGHFHSKKDFRAATFDKLAKILPEGAQMKVAGIMISDDWAIAEIKANGKAISGLVYDNHYCWLTRWEDEKIAEVRAYLDSALVQQLFDENPVDA